MNSRFLAVMPPWPVPSVHPPLPPGLRFPCRSLTMPPLPLLHTAASNGSAPRSTSRHHCPTHHEKTFCCGMHGRDHGEVAKERVPTREKQQKASLLSVHVQFDSCAQLIAFACVDSNLHQNLIYSRTPMFDELTNHCIHFYFSFVHFQTFLLYKNGTFCIDLYF